MAAFNSSVTKIAATIECNSRENGSLYSLKCSGISFQDASNITISSLTIELKLLLPSHNAYRQLSIAGMSFKNSTDVVIQGFDVRMKQMWPADNVVVIAFSDCMNVEMSSLTVTNGGSAVSLEYTRNTTFRNITIHSAGRVGIEMIGLNRSTVSGVHVMQSNGIGIYAKDVYHVIIANTTVEQTQEVGILIYESSDIHINDTHVMQAGINTLDMFLATNITIANTALVNTSIGANIVCCYSVNFWSVTIGDWNLYGVHAYDSYIVSLINISLVQLLSPK